MNKIIILLTMFVAIKIVDKMLSNKPDNIRELAISITGTAFLVWIISTISAPNIPVLQFFIGFIKNLSILALIIADALFAFKKIFE